jgi:Protein of unknown function (DUF2510)
MSQVSPGWYPDPSGRFAQRYHDGSRWTEHVADAEGNRDTDVPVGQAGPGSHAGPAENYGQAGQRSADPYGRSAGVERGYGERSAGDRGYGQGVAGAERGYGGGGAGADRGYRRGGTGADRGYGRGGTGAERGYGRGGTGAEQGYDRWAGDQGWGEDPPGSHPGYDEQRAGQAWDAERQPSEPGYRGRRETGRNQGGAASWQPQAGGPPSRQEWPPAQGATQQRGDGWPARPGGQAEAGPDWRAAGQGQGPARYDAGSHHGQRAGYGQPRSFRDPGYAYAPPASSHAFTPTVGLIVAAVGAVLLLLSLFGLDFLELSFADFSRSVSLGDIAGDFGDGAPAALATYADFGRFLAVLVAVLAILAVTKVVPQLRDVSALPLIVAAACGAFALWHVLAMLANADEGVDVTPTFGAILGLLGYVALAAGPFLRQPLQGRR